MDAGLAIDKAMGVGSSEKRCKLSALLLGLISLALISRDNRRYIKLVSYIVNSG